MIRKRSTAILDFVLFSLAGIVFQILVLPLLLFVCVWKAFHLGIGSTRREFDEKRKIIREAKRL